MYLTRKPSVYIFTVERSDHGSSGLKHSHRVCTSARETLTGTHGGPYGSEHYGVCWTTASPRHAMPANHGEHVSELWRRELNYGCRKGRVSDSYLKHTAGSLVPDPVTPRHLAGRRGGLISQAAGLPVLVVRESRLEHQGCFVCNPWSRSDWIVWDLMRKTTLATTRTAPNDKSNERPLTLVARCKIGG